MRISYCTAPCGSGKSYQAATRMLDCPGRYVVVRDRVQAIEDYAQDLNRFLHSRQYLAVPVAKITSETGLSVRREVEAVPGRYNALPHIIVLITHKALMMSDFSEFQGWHLLIDETPVVLDRQELRTRRSTEFFTRHYQLEPLNKEWSSVTLTRNGWETTPADLESDDVARSMRTFHQRVTLATPLPEHAPVKIKRVAASVQPAVVTNLQDWKEMEDGRQWTWFSVWSPRQLEAFESVEFLANGFDKSVTFELIQTLNPHIEWEERRLTSSRTFQRRKVVIEYFAERHTASMSLFETIAGKSYLGLIRDHLADRDQIWMANERHADELVGMGGLKLQPHQAGSNAYAGYHAATAIYSAKPSAETRGVMNFLGIDPSAWTRSYEHEAILQFVCRTSIRTPESNASVHFAVYDRVQADYLASYFRDQQHCEVEMFATDLGFANVHRTVAGPRAKPLSVEDMNIKIADRRAKRLSRNGGVMIVDDRAPV